MIAKIEITQPNGAGGLEELRTFLVRDPETRRIGRIRWEKPEPTPGKLGDALDVLAIVISGTLALPGFIQVVSNWFRSRGDDQAAVTIALGSTSIVVSGTEDPAKIRHLADVLQAAYPDSTSPGEGP
ncbi:effector-associated constant component EACC1 [Streptomyces sp. WG7]|uniref:effector-associated constant component EACC1 n=1 Tax=Streptomyces sp. WG7 TaxID=3417650 RepID=UPI003CEE5075